MLIPSQTKNNYTLQNYEFIDHLFNVKIGLIVNHIYISFK